MLCRHADCQFTFPVSWVWREVSLFSQKTVGKTTVVLIINRPNLGDWENARSSPGHSLMHSGYLLLKPRPPFPPKRLAFAIFGNWL